MATNYLGQNGLVYLITLIKNGFVKKALKTGSDSEYKVLSDNDFTDALKAQYDAAYTHSTTPHAPAGAEANVLESVKVNGQALPVTAKAVDVPVPLISTNITADATSDLKAASPKAVAGYVAAALAGVSGISAQILTTGEYDEDGVPTVAGQAGVIYLVPMAGGEHNVYREFLYINGAFETIGTTAVDLSGYVQKTDLVEFTNGEIDAIWTSALGE